MGTYAADKTYFVGYEFNLANYDEHLAIFQWYDCTRHDRTRQYYQMLIPYLGRTAPVIRTTIKT